MKSVAIKGKEEFEVIEKDNIEANGKDVLIEITRAGICGSDIHYWQLGQPKGLIMGHEFCGRVIDPGEREDLKVGDKVTALPISPCDKCEACETSNVQYCAQTWTYATGLSLTNPGAYSQRVLVRKDMVIKVPESLSDEVIAMVEPTAVGLHAVHLANIKVGDKVLIIGGGIIGLVSAMFAKMEGASYIAMTETNEKRGKKAVDLKVVDDFYNATDESKLTNLQQKIKEGFDIVIECCGNSSAVSSALNFVKPGGKVVLVGVSLVPVTIPTTLAVMREKNVQGAIAYTVDEFKTCIELISREKIDVKKFVDDIVGLEEVQKAFERLTSGKDDTIKILIDPKK